MKMSIIERYRECDQSFKNREHVKDEFRRNDAFLSICIIICILFATSGVIGDALDVTLALESISWFLLAIIAGFFAMFVQMHYVTARHLLGIESERKKE